MKSPLCHVLERGYFPRELPPPFNTVSFGSFAETKAARDFRLQIKPKKLKANFVSRPAIHNLARAGSLRRKLSIPNPVNQFQVASEIVDGWQQIKALCAESKISLTTPRYTKHLPRAISPRRDFQAIPLARARSRVASKCLLTTDLSQFYPSIYTHSIPWALHSKATAKKQQNDYALLGNRLDLAIRNGQDKQTNGIPIGPDTSLVIAEALLSSVDRKLTGPMTKRGFRYIDDYSCGFRSVVEAEVALGELQKLMGELELQLNPRKTRVTELPVEIEDPWAPPLRLFRIRGASSAQETDLLSFFGRAFELAATRREDAILRYAVQRMRSITVSLRNWSLYESLLLQCLSVEPGTAPAVVAELYKYDLAMPLDLSRITESLEQIIGDHAPLRHGSEVAWSLWGAMCLGCKLSKKSVEAALTASDPCVSLCALDAVQRGLVGGQPDVSGLLTLLQEPELLGEQWLFVYEATVKGWLKKYGGADCVTGSKYFGTLKDAGVSFYDSSAGLAVPQKESDSEYPESESEFEASETSVSHVSEW